MTQLSRGGAAVLLTCLALSTTACTLPGGARASRTPTGIPSVATEASTTLAAEASTALASPATTPAGATMAAAPASPADASNAQAHPSASDTSASPGAPTPPDTSSTGVPSTAPSALATAPSNAAAPGTAITPEPGRTLALHAQDAVGEGWARGGAIPRGSQFLIESLAGQASCNGPALTLTFLLAQPTTGTATFQLSQDARSSSTTERLAWSSEVDNVAGPTTTVGYDQHVALTVPLKDASRVTLKLANVAPCTGTATGLVTGATITS